MQRTLDSRPWNIVSIGDRLLRDGNIPSGGAIRTISSIELPQGDTATVVLSGANLAARIVDIRRELHLASPRRARWNAPCIDP